MRGRWAAGIAPRNFAWILKDQLAVSERPGGFAPHHRRVRRQEEILWLHAQGFTRVVSLLPSNHNLRAYDELHIPSAHFALPSHGDPRPVLGELYASLWGWLHGGERVLLHQDELGEQLAGVVAGFLCWSRLLPEPPRAVSAVEQLLRRQMGHAGRTLVAAAADMPSGPSVRSPQRSLEAVPAPEAAASAEAAAPAGAAPPPEATDPHRVVFAPGVEGSVEPPGAPEATTSDESPASAQPGGRTHDGPSSATAASDRVAKASAATSTEQAPTVQAAPTQGPSGAPEAATSATSSPATKAPAGGATSSKAPAARASMPKAPTATGPAGKAPAGKASAADPPASKAPASTAPPARDALPTRTAPTKAPAAKAPAAKAPAAKAPAAKVAATKAAATKASSATPSTPKAPASKESAVKAPGEAVADGAGSRPGRRGEGDGEARGGSGAHQEAGRRTARR